MIEIVRKDSTRARIVSSGTGWVVEGTVYDNNQQTTEYGIYLTFKEAYEALDRIKDYIEQIKES